METKTTTVTCECGHEASDHSSDFGCEELCPCRLTKTEVYEARLAIAARLAEALEPFANGEVQSALCGSDRRKVAMKIFLAVCWDRHVDDDYAAFTKLSDAIEWCQEGERDYNESRAYEFRQSEVQGWNYFSDSGDDCPSFHVEEIELDAVADASPQEG